MMNVMCHTHIPTLTPSKAQWLVTLFIVITVVVDYGVVLDD